MTKLTPENALETLRAMLAGSPGLTGAEIVIHTAKTLQLEAQDGGLEAFRRQEGAGIGIRLARDQRIAQSYSSQLELAELKNLTARCFEMLDHVPDDPGVQLLPLEFSGDSHLGSSMVDPTFERVDADEKINRTLNLEANVLRFDPRVKRTRGTQYREAFVSEWLWTLGSKKALLTQKTYGSLSTGAVAEENGDSQIAYEGLSETHYYDLDWGAVAKDAAQNAVKLLGSKPIQSGKYAVIFPSRLAAEVLSVLSSTFSGENVAQRLSFLDTKRMGQEIFSSQINLVDDSLQKKRPGTAYWDSEGVPTQRLVLVDQGKLSSFAHNHKSARLLGVKSTGNAVRGSERLTPSVGYHNLMIEPGKKDFVDLLRDLGRGLVLTKIIGLHTANSVTGEFSVGVAGTWVENGEEKSAVSGMTLSGSLLQIMQNVEAVGRDLRWRGSFGAPSILCRDLTLSGK